MNNFNYDENNQTFHSISDSAKDELVLSIGGLLKKVKSYDPDKSLSRLTSVAEDSDALIAPINTSAEPFKDTPFDYLYGKEYALRKLEMNGLKLCLISFDYKQGFDKKQLLKDIESNRKDCDFVILLGRKNQKKLFLKKLANGGADYIVFNDNQELGKNETIKTKDGRNVRVVNSLGTLIGTDSQKLSAFVRIRIFKDFDGNVNYMDEYIPCFYMMRQDKSARMIYPLNPYYSSSYKEESHKEHISAIKNAFGDEIKPSAKTEVLHNRNGFMPQLSIREIYELLGKNPEDYKGEFPIDEKVQSVIIRTTELVPGCVAFLDNRDKHGDRTAITKEQAIEAGAILIVSEEKIDNYPSIQVEEVFEEWVKICKRIKSKYDVYTVGITGTIGKSTTTDMIKTVMKYGYNVLDVRGNYNTYRGVGFCVQKLNDSFDAYVQEIHEGTRGSASCCSQIIAPNAAVVTFVGDAHLSQLGGTVHDVLRETLSIADGLKDGGKLYINNDNEYLKNADIKDVDVVRCGIYNKESDYYAEDIKDYGNKLEFTIVCKAGRFPATLNVAGAYNIGNAIIAFAVGMDAGIAPHKLVSALSRFRTTGYRQHAFEQDGYKLLVDCASATPDSMLSSLDALAKMIPAEGKHRVAVLGNVAMLGKSSKSWHTKFGEHLVELGIDKLLCYGKRGAIIGEVASSHGVETQCFMDEFELEKAIKETIEKGDAILFKSSPKGGADLTDTVTRLFGKL
ncbi:MAG: UDP-N-acetylmuramoyl-tripeptide--D-alanyl-D-alanine ligase [Clostridia bacterium]|nr:UDP-N-acetylmuramoyl-tripeptide--D-alanyl-D-alanine ligase [Clostridia bacterium]